ncbi:hypothetical protein ILYODFUR_013492 [Ilyodon furcidens]|uniref:V-SNARE coiled-coil homology domain-containing protein n=1 Tax=Ilyodon furcidens TaxID=33524 RepID=A0ABV0T9H3_9TELE
MSCLRSSGFLGVLLSEPGLLNSSSVCDGACFFSCSPSPECRFFCICVFMISHVLFSFSSILNSYPRKVSTIQVQYVRGNQDWIRIFRLSVQSQVDEVIDVMQENISKVIERGERLDDLQDKSESLSDHASAFSSRAKQLHRRMWWRDTKMKMIIALVVVALLLIIIVPVILRYR